MELSFPRYLLSKQSVDERALNQHVYQSLVEHLPARRLRVIEVGAGVGTMLARLLGRGLFTQVDYVAVDEQAGNIAAALDWLPGWAVANGWDAQPGPGPASLRLSAPGTGVVDLELVQADVFDFIHSAPLKADLLIAHAFLDLLPLPEALPQLFSLLEPGGLAWLTLNFDGVTTFEPSTNDPALDATIERLYHQSMDTRPSGGDSRTGRHLFGHLRVRGAQVLAAGASDWVVYPQDGRYPGDEAYFLGFILHFFESALSGHPGLDPAALAGWLAARRAQLQRAELVYIAHQMDFLVRP